MLNYNYFYRAKYEREHAGYSAHVKNNIEYNILNECQIIVTTEVTK